MSNPVDFLARWSRRKRQAARNAKRHELSPRTPEPDPKSGEGDPGPISPSGLSNGSRLSRSTAASCAAVKRSAGTTPANESAAPQFDLSRLPSPESISAETDIRPFLAPGVPAELTRTALRRAWAADPAIRDHVGLSENSWDFNAQDAMPGFGPLDMTEALSQAVDRMLGRTDVPDGSEAAREDQTKSPAAWTEHSGQAIPDSPDSSADESQKCDATK